MKYDDASWHSGGTFPKDSPPEYGGTHIGLLLKWCLLKGWIGELHVTDSTADVECVKRGEMSGTSFLFRNCDGKFTDEDLNDEGNAFISKYYAQDGPYLGDYSSNFGEIMYVASEEKHDYRKFSEMVERRYAAQTGAASKPWWKFW